MLPKWHIILGAIFSIILYLFFSLSVFQLSIVFLSSFLIDFDHYLYYSFIKKDFSLKKAHEWFLEKRKKWLLLTKKQKQNFKSSIFIFHGIEFWLILLIFSFLNKIFIFMLIGIFFHIFLDFIELFYLEIPFYSKFSQVYTYIKNKDKIYFN